MTAADRQSKAPRIASLSALAIACAAVAAAGLAGPAAAAQGVATAAEVPFPQGHAAPGLHGAPASAYSQLRWRPACPEVRTRSISRVPASIVFQMPPPAPEK